MIKWQRLGCSAVVQHGRADAQATRDGGQGGRTKGRGLFAGHMGGGGIFRAGCGAGGVTLKEDEICVCAWAEAWRTLGRRAVV